MRIVHYIDQLDTMLAYQESVLARAQQKLGHEVHIITSEMAKLKTGRNRVGWQGVGTFTYDNVTLHRLPILVAYQRRIMLLKGVQKTLAAIRPEVVHCHNIFYNATAFQLTSWRHVYGYALVFDSHTAYFNSKPNRSAAKRVFHRIFSKLVTAYPRDTVMEIACVGTQERDFLKRELGISDDQLRLIHLSVDIDFFRPDQDLRRVYRERLGVNDADKVIIHAGKLGRNKGTDLLVGAAAKVVASQTASLRLVVAGRADPMFELTLQRQAQSLGERVIRLPFLNLDDLVGYFNAADLGVWPEDPTISSVQALACGLPLVLSDDEYSPYIVRPEWGWQISGEESLVSALNQFLCLTSDGITEMRRLAREYATLRLSSIHEATDYDAFYRSAMLRQNGRAEKEILAHA